MYTEEYEKKGFPIKGFIMRLLLVVIFVLLLVWLLPKFIRPVVSTDSKTTSNCVSGATCDLSGLNALTSQIFADNIERMKNAAISYYTDERLPKTVGDSSQLTLSEMIGKKLLPALIDKNNKAVDVENSYVKITKSDSEYLLKVNIKDSEKEDYILAHLGCYTYCENGICVKRTVETVPTKAAKPTPTITPTTPVTPTPVVYTYKCQYVNGKYFDANGNRVSELNYIISCQAPRCSIVSGYYFGKNGNNVTKSKYERECSTPVPPTPTTHKCEYYNGKYYDRSGNAVSEVNYIISCQAPKCKIVNGYYFGKNGNNVSKATYKKECTTPPTPTTHKCEYYNGKYYDKNGNEVSEVNYIISCQAPKCKIVNGYYFGKNGDNVSKATYEKECTTPPTPTVHKCEYYNGKYYDKNGNAVSEVNYIISCQAPKCKIVNGYYFGKNGNNVNKATYEKECTTPTVHKCEYYNGKYYDKNGNVVSEVNYIISCQAPKCKIVNGYYFGKNGNNVDKATYEKECTTPVEYIYEYKKVTATRLSAWTDWSSWAKADCATKEINCNDADTTCLNKLQMLKRKEKIGTYQKTYAKKRQVIKQTGSYTQKACNKYNYVEINRTLYATTTTTTYTTINTITTTTRTSHGGWTYNGRASYSNPPSDSSSTHYKFVGADYSNCGDSCTSLPNYYYDSYTYSGGLTSVSSTTTPGKTTTSTSTTTTPVTTETSYEASCGGYTTKTIPIYGTITVTEKATRTEPLYGDVCYKSTKSRKVVEQGSTKYKWSKYNDTSLLNDGWVYTGNKKVK